MYFPLFKRNGWGKRYAVQPKPNYSEFPWEKAQFPLAIKAEIGYNYRN